MVLLAQKLKEHPRPKRLFPLWLGPQDSSARGGVTQSMLQRFLCCRERFRIKYLLGLNPSQGWNRAIGYGDMWHVCEEAAAAGLSERDIVAVLIKHMQEQFQQYPFERDLIQYWATTCLVQFPCYRRFWQQNPDQESRQSIYEESEFHIAVKLPSGRTIYLRGKWDSVDWIPSGSNAGIWLMENKTKGKIVEAQLRRQLKFDLQTMTYLSTLRQHLADLGPKSCGPAKRGTPLRGVRYNVIRRPFSGGWGQISQHKPTKKKPRGETLDEFFARFQRDYLDTKPEYWFMRWNCLVNQREIDKFLKELLYPVLEQLASWYEWAISAKGRADPYANSLHWRAPFGVYDPLKETGATEYDSYIETGNEAGLVFRQRLFPELMHEISC